METQFAEKELGECLELVIDHRGKTPKKLGSDWVASGVPTISAKNVKDGRLVATDDIRYVNHDVYRRWMKEDVKPGDCFLVSEGATLGECMLWDHEYPIVLGQRIFCLRANPAVLYPRYLYAYMTSASFQSEIIGRATGTSVDGLRQTELLKLKLRLPPLSQQKHIGDALYNLNKKIELNRRMHATLEAMARALFQSWFVDFDPVRAKLDGRQPFGLDPETAALFPNSFQDSKLGHIPIGWKVERVSDVMTFEGGAQPPATDFIHEPREGYVRLVQIRDFYTSDHLTFVPDTKKLRKFSTDDLMLARYGSSGNAASGSDSLGRVCRGMSGAYNVALVKVVPLRPIREFLLYFLKSQAFQGTIKGMGARSVQSGFRKEDLDVIYLVTAPQEVHEAFERFALDIWRQTFAKDQESNTLAALRDTLLPKLLSGEIRVKDIL